MSEIIDAYFEQVEENLRLRNILEHLFNEFYAIKTALYNTNIIPEYDQLAYIIEEAEKEMNNV